MHEGPPTPAFQRPDGGAIGDADGGGSGCNSRRRRRPRRGPPPNGPGPGAPAPAAPAAAGAPGAPVPGPAPAPSPAGGTPCPGCGPLAPSAAARWARRRATSSISPPTRSMTRSVCGESAICGASRSFNPSMICAAPPRVGCSSVGGSPPSARGRASSPAANPAGGKLPVGPRSPAENAWPACGPTPGRLIGDHPGRGDGEGSTSD